jgi:hypothetical protein
MEPMGPGGRLADAFFVDRGNYAEIVEPLYLKHMTRLPPAKGKYDWIGLSSLLNAARVWRPNWSDFRPWHMSSETGAAISDSVLRQIIKDDSGQLLRFVDVIRRTTPVFVIEPPWPFRDQRAVKQNGGAKIMHVHRLYRDYVMKELQDRNVPVVEIDRNWVDADGYTDPKFQRDPVHGNAMFARAMMERVEAFLAAQAADTAKRSVAGQT